MAVDARIAPGTGAKYDRQAVVNEAYYSICGQKYFYPTADLGQWNYLASDLVAYQHTRDAWSGRYPINGIMTDADDPVLKKYFVDNNIQSYGYYKNVGRGGQCKYFANLILYRAGISNLAKVDPMPTYDRMRLNQKSSKYVQPGDVIIGNGHTAIVVQVLAGKSATGTVTKVQVVDSNYKGDEMIGKHIMYSTELSKYVIWTGVPYYSCT